MLNPLFNLIKSFISQVHALECLLVILNKISTGQQKNIGEFAIFALDATPNDISLTNKYRFQFKVTLSNQIDKQDIS